MAHRVTIRLRSFQGISGIIPWKWEGRCQECPWTCLSWQWLREDGTGALRMSVDHYTEMSAR